MATSDYLRRNVYIDKYLPFQQEMWRLSLAAAEKQAQGEQAKLAIRQKYIDSLTERRNKLRQIKADFEKEWAQADNDIDKQAVLAKREEELERLKITSSAMKTNAEARTEMAKTQTYAQSNIEAARIRAKDDQAKDVRATQLQETRDKIQSVNKEGSRDRLGPALVQYIDAPILGTRLGDAKALRDFPANVEVVLNQASLKGLPPPVEAIAESVSKVADPGYRGQLADAARSKLSGTAKEDFDKAYNLFLGKNPDGSTYTGDGVPKLSGGYIDPAKAGNVALPDAQGEYINEAEAQKDMSALRYGRSLADVNKELDLIDLATQQAYKDALAYQSPDIIDLARNIYADKFAMNPKLPNIQMPNIKLPAIDLKRRAELSALGELAPIVGTNIAPTQYPSITIPENSISIPGMPVPPEPLLPYQQVKTALKPSSTTPQQPRETDSQKQAPPFQLPSLPGSMEREKAKPPIPDEPNPDSDLGTPGVEAVQNKNTFGDRVLAEASSYTKQKNRVDRLMANDPITKAAAAMYAIDRRNSVSPKETAAKLTQQYKSNPKQLERALSVVTYLFNKDTEQPSLKGMS